MLQPPNTKLKFMSIYNSKNIHWWKIKEMEQKIASNKFY